MIVNRAEMRFKLARILAKFLNKPVPKILKVK